MKKIPLLTLPLIGLCAATTQGATIPQTANGDDGLGVFSSSGGSGVNSGTFVGGSDIGNAWGFYASNTEVSQGLYDFTGGALTVGQSVTFQMDNGSIQTNGVVGFGFQSISNANNRAEFYFKGGDSNYTLSDNSGANDSSIGFTSTGLTIAFTLTGADSYSMDVTPLGSSTINFAGTLGGTASSGIDRLRFFNFDAGTGSDKDAFFNNINVVPEPGTYALIAGMLGFAYVAMRRRS